MNSEELNDYLKKRKENGLEAVGLWQVRIAANMGLPREQLDYLSIPSLSFTNREWLYISMLEGVPLEQMAALPLLTSDSIAEMRQSYFKNKYSKETEYIKDLTAFCEEIKKQLETSRSLCGFLQEQGEKERKEQEEIQAAARRNEEELCRLEEENKKLVQQLENANKENAGLQERLSQYSDDGKSDDMQEKECDPGGTDTQNEITDNMDAENGNLSVWRRILHWLRSWKQAKQRKKDDEAFIFMLQKIPFSPEQKSYLLRCREEGDSMEIIRSIAFEAFDPTTMARIREILSENKTEKKGRKNGETGKASSDDG